MKALIREVCHCEFVCEPKSSKCVQILANRQFRFRRMRCRTFFIINQLTPMFDIFAKNCFHTLSVSIRSLYEGYILLYGGATMPMQMPVQRKKPLNMLLKAIFLLWCSLHQLMKYDFMSSWIGKTARPIMRHTSPSNIARKKPKRVSKRQPTLSHRHQMWNEHICQCLIFFFKNTSL